jgi:hypothetical protein
MSIREKLRTRTEPVYLVSYFTGQSLVFVPVSSGKTNTLFLELATDKFISWFFVGRSFYRNTELSTLGLSADQVLLEQRVKLQESYWFEAKREASDLVCCERTLLMSLQPPSLFSALHRVPSHTSMRCLPLALLNEAFWIANISVITAKGIDYFEC